MTEKQIELCDDRFHEWLDKNNNLMEIPPSESLGNAYFDGYEKGQASVVALLADYLHISLTFKNWEKQLEKLFEGTEMTEADFYEDEKLKEQEKTK